MAAPAEPGRADAAAVQTTDWRLAAVLLAAGVIAAVQIGKAPPALPLLRAELGLDLQAAGWFVSLITAMTAAAGMLVALAADRIGHRQLLLGGLVIGAAASALSTLVTSPSALFGLRIVEGLGFLSVVVSVPPLLLHATAPGDTRFMMGIWGAYLPAGAGLMALASAGLLPLEGWRGVWWLAAASLMAMAVVVAASAAGRAPPAASADRSLTRDVVETLSVPGPALIGLCFGCYAGSWYAVIAFLPTLQVERLGFSPSLAALTTAGVILINVTGSLVAGWLLQRGWRRSVVIAVTAVLMAGTAAGILLDAAPDAARLACAFAFSMVASAIPGALFGAIPVHAPRPGLIGATTGALMQGSNIGSLTGPPIVAALVSANGWASALWYTTPALALAAAAGFALQRREPRPGAGRPAGRAPEPG
ncbi:MAG: MFS transporter [Rhodospirillales bacterium]|nr:MAG: MFS transporter [Rhodospirillales bacterium]